MAVEVDGVAPARAHAHVEPDQLDRLVVGHRDLVVAEAHLSSQGVIRIFSEIIGFFICGVGIPYRKEVIWFCRFDVA